MPVAESEVNIREHEGGGKPWASYFWDFKESTGRLWCIIFDGHDSCVKGGGEMRKSKESMSFIDRPHVLELLKDEEAKGLSPKTYGKLIQHV